MPTEEERLRVVEFDLKQFKTETVRVYQDMAFEITILKGLTEDSIKRLMGVGKTLDEHTAQLASIGGRLDQVDSRLDRVDSRLDRVDSRLDRVDTHLDQVDSRLGRVEGLLTQILARLPEKP